MKTSLFLLSLLLGAATAQAQVPAAPTAPATEAMPDKTTERAEDAAKPVEFGFNADFDQVQNHIIWKGVSDDGQNKIDFFVYDSGNKGVPLAETIAFFDENKRSLATLNVSFDETGKIQNQELLGADDKPMATEGRNMNLLTVAGSGISVETTVKAGWLRQRVFTLKFPTWNGVLTSDYDERGRRARDVFSSSTAEQPSIITYSYEERGLNAVKAAASNDNGEIRIEAQRNEAGENIRTRMFYNGELRLIATPLRDEQGKVNGSRTENYDGGEVSDIVEIRGQTEGDVVSTTLTQTDAKGVIQERQLQTEGRTIFVEEFENGKLRQRVDFDKNGEPLFVTHYKDDGSVEWKKTIGPDGQLQDEPPAKG